MRIHKKRRKKLKVSVQRLKALRQCRRKSLSEKKRTSESRSRLRRKDRIRQAHLPLPRRRGMDSVPHVRQRRAALCRVPPVPQDREWADPPETAMGRAIVPREDSGRTVLRSADNSRADLRPARSSRREPVALATVDPVWEVRQDRLSATNPDRETALAIRESRTTSAPERTGTERAADRAV